MAVKTDGYAESRARQRPSPSIQRMDFGLLAMKTNYYAEGRARQDQVLARSGQSLV